MKLFGIQSHERTNEAKWVVTIAGVLIVYCGKNGKKIKKSLVSSYFEVFINNYL